MLRSPVTVGEVFSVEPQARPTGRQFSLHFLFVVMTVTALGCGLAVLLPVEVSQLLIGLVWIVATSVLLIGVFFGRGDQRAFCIGASVVISSMWTGIGGRFMQGVHYSLDLVGLGMWQPVVLWLDVAVLALTAIANGWLCVRARAYFEREKN